MTDYAIQAELQACREALEVIEARWQQAVTAFDDYRQRVDGEREAELAAHRQRLEAEHKAELDKVRQRAERELERVRQHERETVLRDWLEVVDNLERALMHRDRSALGRLWEGLMAVYRQAQGLLRRYEIARIATRGVHFDPAYHEAVGRAQGAPDGVIVEEVKPGYCIGDTVLRPAQVIVAVQEAPRRSPYGI
jgi:molecular chaperone GrpE